MLVVSVLLSRTAGVSPYNCVCRYWTVWARGELTPRWGVLSMMPAGLGALRCWGGQHMCLLLSAFSRFRQ